MNTDYGSAIRLGFQHLLRTRPAVFCIGQGLWSPWYVGNTMTDLEKEFGLQRVIDTPVSELATTGAALGAALAGYRPVVVHPRLDFMLLATDQIVTQAANWSSMFGGQVAVPLTVRAIVNRGGEQGAQHSQALHAWFAHVPGLRVVMPATPADARDLLVSSVLCDDPVLYLDDRWLYDSAEELPDLIERPLRDERPILRHKGNDVTLVGAGYSAALCMKAAARLQEVGVMADVIDLRIINPLDDELIIRSVEKTGRLLAVDGGFASCGLSAEVIARAACQVAPTRWRAAPQRVTLPPAPAPTSSKLELTYYPSAEAVVEATRRLIGIQEEK